MNSEAMKKPDRRKKKKDVRGARPNAGKIVLIALGVLAALLAAALLGLFIAGFRYRTVTYKSVLGSDEQTISFMGFVAGDGSLKKGELFYGQKKGAVERTETGKYEIVYSTGDRYEGDMDGLQRQGQGTMLYSTGDRYDGGFENDRFQGYGVFAYASGDRYEGNFAAGKKSGEGRYVWAGEDGAMQAEYSGSFRNDRRDGYGVYRTADGTVYAGNFTEDLKNDPSAEALIPAPNGGMDRYYGGYENDVRSGQGSYFYAGGDVYRGQFQNNKPHGQGTIYFADGGSFTGTFEDGVLKKEDAKELSEEEAASQKENLSEGINPYTGLPAKIEGGSSLTKS